MKADRRILHLDMDCFYAAVEMRENPSLAKRPIAVGGASGRGVLTTCNYPAREYGVRSAMPVFKARALCPDLLVLPVRSELYRQVSRQVRGIMSEFSDLVEPLSLDEAYLDISHHRRPGAEIAQELRDRIQAETGLTASAGVAPNKLIAKIASDWNKPNGQCIVAPSRVEEFMRDLPVRRIWGIGPKSAQRMRDLGIETCGDLQTMDRATLVDRFGSFGLELFQLSRGIDDRPVQPNRIRKSLSNERTFRRDLESLEDCELALREQHKELVEELRLKALERPVAKLFVKLKFSDFRRTTAECPAKQPEIEICLKLLREGWGRSGLSVRLLGVGVRFAETGNGAEQLEFAL